ncbi:saccharopine dehydrogenase NADP-binding domain-containing protein [Bacillus altitudinis]|uniref:Saccharopine dehydrogenase NADP-binding domain-containing protein n=1 Tax=Bacillus aerius TaxID=293388 RepID=A0AB39J4R9_9BACI|nr:MULTISPECIES: saccharopine dehydrogenase NADP-binding domain-containing protein [Bacillus]AHL73382.1 saccharopine dehydrogenase [Bacillus pumilus]KML05452.1 saccharopine dehydrogenase [Bacillus stratosphericus]MBR3206422.1 saccharopine dehydrogenase NADP-binding domain-containing protein [Bacillus sp. (in: firmicutes)]QAR52536.1 saccharopine dehydrogenase [Bacillus aerophilus]AMB91568.1 saccharopine dehydrogenase [Bacillus altitudinis]
MRSKVMVIGGYGHVGQQICLQLSDVYPGQVFAAGRSYEKAEQFARQTNGRVRPFQIDVRQPMDTDWMDETKLVIMCLDQDDTSFAETCLRSGIDYLDISAKGAYIEKLAKVHQQQLNATAVLSVGLAPGLTNLLAAKAASILTSVEQIDISIMLGLGDQHGKAAIEWTLDHVHTDYELTKNHQRKKVKSFTGGKRIDFGKTLGKRQAYQFPFSDQQTLPSTLHVPSVTTRLCFDSGVATRAFALTRKLGMTSLLTMPKIKERAISLIQSAQMGTDQYAVKVEAVGMKGNEIHQAALGIKGRDESQATAQVASAAALHVLSRQFQAGVFHIEELFSLAYENGDFALVDQKTKEKHALALRASLLTA